MTEPAWHIVTGEYAPGRGGVGDYTRAVARALAAAGDEVHVWAPETMGHLAEDPGVHVHTLRAGFSPAGLRTLSREFAGQRRPRRLLLQYVPQAFGMRGLNVPFCLWIASLRCDEVWVMFHEVALPWHALSRWKWNAGAAVTRVMAGILTARADRVFVSVPTWERMLRAVAPRWRGATWLPIPSNVPASTLAAGPSDGAAVVRSRLPHASRNAPVIGHFGTYGAGTTPALREILPRLLAADPSRVALLVGRRGEALAAEIGRAPEFAGRVIATGDLEMNDVADQVRSCDVLVQPYPDGVSSRRTTVMTGLALGVPIATNEGPSSETLWRQERVVELADDASGIAAAAEALLRDRPRALAVAERARSLYDRRFSLERTVQALRTAAADPRP